MEQLKTARLIGQAMIGISCRKNLGKSRSKSKIYYRDRKMIRFAQPIVSETIEI
jgi:hypothetical protein